MPPNLREIYQACNPCQVLDVRRSRDRDYYVDLSDVRGGDRIGDIEAAISLFSPRVPTYHLLSGQVGSGKSVELLRLQSLLAANQFQTVYIEVSRYLDMADVDVVDLVLAIASDVARAMTAWNLDARSPTLEAILERANTFVRPFDREISPAPHAVSHSPLHRLLVECVGRMREYPLQRMQLRQFLDAQLPAIVEAIAHDLIGSSTEHLRSRGIENIVIIVDNLDRLSNTSKSWGRLQSEYLFVDRGEWLQKFGCHAIYTVPIGLLFSKEIGSLQARFDTDPIVLPLVPLYRRDGSLNPDGLDRLKQIVLRRMFAHAPNDRDLAQFCREASAIDLLCRVSGGHVRNLLRLLHRWIEKERDLPLSIAGLQAAIGDRRARIDMSLSQTDLTLLQQFDNGTTTKAQAIPNDFLRSGLMLEYRDDNGSWFSLDPIVRHALQRD